MDTFLAGDVWNAFIMERTRFDSWRDLVRTAAGERWRHMARW